MTTETCCTEPSGAETQPIRVLLVDDHSIMREGLRSMLRDSR